MPGKKVGTVFPATSHGAALLVSPVRRAVVEALADLSPESRRVGLSAAELGLRLALHPTTIRFHVDQLVTAGVLEAHFVRSGGAGRPSKKYLLREDRLARTADEAPSGPFEVLAGLLAETLSTSEAGALTPEEAGVRWAQRRALETPAMGADGPSPGPHRPSAPATKEEITEAVIHLLGEWGYTPGTGASPDGAVDVTLRDCPFLELAHTHPDVVCGVHRGLLRGALDAVGADDATVSLHPFITPTTCRARLYLDHPNGVDPVLDSRPVPAAPAPGRGGAAPEEETVPSTAKLPPSPQQPRPHDRSTPDLRPQ